ncbi:ABC transporter ATP-binding protein [Erythrobacter oryzae]|uniref:ABC transporter ATP-binding protein n=1 Tax=Erythrobacter oryzae TaxID=3019556 RepID=UPI0025567BC4|nr:ABC transporter ATP-binding protein [Erythrobacter sp. COR-2]
MLSLKNLWVEYGEKVVLERISLEIAEKSFVSIIGPSGAGKSSLLRVILGQEKPTRGSISLDGAPLPTECGPDRGVVFQRYSVFPHLTVLGNVLLGVEFAASPFTARLFGSARRAAVAEAEAMLEQVGLADSRHLYPAQMSGGMQQRLAIAQALIKRPRILLLDEPFGALDPGIRGDMHGLITRLWREHGLTIIMVTHDIKEAFGLGTRVLTLDKRRHDPHAPQRYGAGVVYDLELTRKVQQVHAEPGMAEIEQTSGITIDTIGNN